MQTKQQEKVKHQEAKQEARKELAEQTTMRMVREANSRVVNDALMKRLASNNENLEGAHDKTTSREVGNKNLAEQNPAFEEVSKEKLDVNMWNGNIGVSPSSFPYQVQEKEFNNFLQGVSSADLHLKDEKPPELKRVESLGIDINTERLNIIREAAAGYISSSLDMDNLPDELREHLHKTLFADKVRIIMAGAAEWISRQGEKPSFMKKLVSGIEKDAEVYSSLSV